MTLRYPIHHLPWVHAQCVLLADEHGMDRWVMVGEGEEEVIGLRASGGADAGLKRVYISAGLHGDEPAGVLAILLWLERFAQWRGRLSIDLFPCLNPWGMQRNMRTDSGGIDLNRAYGTEGHPFIDAHQNFLRSSPPYDLALLLHEDYDAQGLYAYENTNQPVLWGPDLLRAATKICPVEKRQQIEGHPVVEGVIVKDFAEDPGVVLFEAAQLFYSGCPRVLTIETPSELDLLRRAEAQIEIFEAALSRLLF